MPAGKGKRMLRCSIAEDLHVRLMTEAQAREVDLGAIVEGRLEQSFENNRREGSLIEARLDVLGQQQLAMLNAIEELVKVITGGPVESTPTEEAVPIATYEQMYEAQTPTPPSASEPTIACLTGRWRWPFSGGSNG